jgi:hypothetical protein
MASVAACRSERAARKRTQCQVEIEVRVIFFQLNAILSDTHAIGAPSQGRLGSRLSMRPAFRPAAGGARAAGNRDQGARSCSKPRIAPRFALTSVALTNRGSSARGPSAVHHVREEGSAPLEPPARRRTVGLGATTQAPIDLNQRDPRAQRRPRSMPLPSPEERSRPSMGFARRRRPASPVVGRRRGQRSDLPRSIGSVPLEIPFPNVSRPA